MDPLQYSVEALTELGLLANDATVYVALVKAKKASPSALQDLTGIRRPRIYDALKRLIARGFVLKDLSTKQPKYSPVNPEVVVSDLRRDFEKKHALLKDLGPRLQQLYTQKEGKEGAEIFPFDPKTVANLLKDILQSTNVHLSIQIPHSHQDLLAILLKTLSKPLKKPPPQAKCILSDPSPQIVELLTKLHWTLEQWNPEVDLPFAMIVNDTGSCLLFFQEIGLAFSKMDPKLAKGYAVLFQLMRHGKDLFTKAPSWT